MTRTRKTIAIISGTILVAIVLFFIVLATFDWNRLKPTINQKVSAELNRPFAIRGDLGVVWERQLGTEQREGQAQRVRSTKRLGPAGQLEECTDGGLSMALDLRVEDGALVFYSQRYFLQFGRWRLPVPACFTPGTCRVEHRDVGPGRFRFTLDMVHPLWGHTFHQTGVFADPEEFSS